VISGFQNFLNLGVLIGSVLLSTASPLYWPAGSLSPSTDASGAQLRSPCLGGFRTVPCWESGGTPPGAVAGLRPAIRPSCRGICVLVCGFLGGPLTRLFKVFTGLPFLANAPGLNLFLVSRECLGCPVVLTLNCPLGSL
jgi:hypothetical protein